MKKILVAVDGSENSEKALREARIFGEALNANVDIVKVIEEVVVNPYVVEQYFSTEDFKPAAEKILSEALKFFEDFKGEVNTLCRVGEPANVIIKEVEKEGYDMVIMGSRGLGTFSRAMLGSVSNKVINHVKTNVLIVK